MIALDMSAQEAAVVLADHRSRWLELDGLRVHYKEQGAGPAVILLHNSGMWCGIWDDWLSPLAASLRVIAPDLPGFGLTGPAPSGDYSLERLSAFLRRFMDGLELSSAQLVGLSLGGELAWRFALDAPERVGGLVLINPTGSPHRSLPLVFRFGRSPFGGLLRLIGSHWLIRATVAGLFRDRGRLSDEFVARLRVAHRRAGNRKAFLAFLRTRQRDRDGELARLSCPVQLQWSKVCGAPDLALSVHAQLVLFDDVGHLPVLECPEASLSAARAFLLERARAPCRA